MSKRFPTFARPEGVTLEEHVAKMPTGDLVWHVATTLAIVHGRDPDADTMNEALMYAVRASKELDARIPPNRKAREAKAKKRPIPFDRIALLVDFARAQGAKSVVTDAVDAWLAGRGR